MTFDNLEDLEGVDFADQMLDAIQKDYGRKIMRIPKFKQVSKLGFKITIIFTDYRLLEANIKVVNLLDMPSITIEGIYY
jgi:hypothetical protein